MKGDEAEGDFAKFQKVTTLKLKFSPDDNKEFDRKISFAISFTHKYDDVDYCIGWNSFVLETEVEKLIFTENFCEVEK